MSVYTVTNSNFRETVLQSDKPVLVDLWAPWCGPCRMMSPVVEEISEDHPEIKVCKINVDEEPELAQAFRASSIPMLALIREGKIVKASVGARPKSQVEEMLK